MVHTAPELALKPPVGTLHVICLADQGAISWSAFVCTALIVEVMTSPATRSASVVVTSHVCCATGGRRGRSRRQVRTPNTQPGQISRAPILATSPAAPSAILAAPFGAPWVVNPASSGEDPEPDDGTPPELKPLSPQGSPRPSEPSDHSPHSATPQKPDAGHGLPCRRHRRGDCERCAEQG